MTDARPAARQITLCADDYGISPGVNRAICELAAKRRLSSTSVMVVGPAVTRSEIDQLKAVADSTPGFRIGLHVTLTAPFHPLTLHFCPVRDGEFVKLGRLLQMGVLRRLDVEIMQAEISAQLAAFADLFGHMPSYVDGHQHVQLFPQVRDAFVTAVKAASPDSWVRQCGKPEEARRHSRNPKALLLDLLSRRFRERATRENLRFNPAFAGAYKFEHPRDFAKLFEGFLRGMPDHGLIMCHPGFVDATLVALDPFTHQRKVEYDWLMSDGFPALLAANNVSLA